MGLPEVRVLSEEERGIKEKEYRAAKRDFIVQMTIMQKLVGDLEDLEDAIKKTMQNLDTLRFDLYGIPPACQHKTTQKE